MPFHKARVGNWNWGWYMHSERVGTILIRISIQRRTFFVVIKFTSLLPVCKRNGLNRSTYSCSRTHKENLLPTLTEYSSEDLLWISRNQHARLYFGIHSTFATLGVAFIPTLSMRLWQRFCGLGLFSLSRTRSAVPKNFVLFIITSSQPLYLKEVWVYYFLSRSIWN